MTSDSTITVWDLATGREVRRIEGHLAMVNVAAFAPDGRSLISGSSDCTAMVWDVSDLANSIADQKRVPAIKGQDVRR